MNALGFTSQDQPGPSAAPATALLRAHPALPASQQLRINAWIDAMPPGTLQHDDMPQLIELARHMDRAERILAQMHETPPDDVCARQSLADLVAAEEARIQALSARLRVPVTPQ